MSIPYYLDSLDDLKRKAVLSGLISIECFNIGSPGVVIPANAINAASIAVTAATGVLYVSGLTPVRQAPVNQQVRIRGIQDVLRRAALSNEEIARKSIFEESMPDEELSFPAVQISDRARIGRLRRRP